jgi:Transposase DDE domain
MVITVERSAVGYLDILDKELSTLPGYHEPEVHTEEKKLVKSSTDTDCGYINHQTKKGLGYLAEMTVDTKIGIVTGVDVYPANRRESDIILRHLNRQMKDTGLEIKEIALDGGYDVGAVHRGLELLGIRGYCSPREYHNNALKKGFEYDPDNDRFICPQGKYLLFERMVYKKPNANYFRLYSISLHECKSCNFRQHCAVDNGNQKRVASSRYKYLRKMRSIWSEGTFSALKREHKLKRAVKRGINRVVEECLLSALALNLKRMVAVLCLTLKKITLFKFNPALAN